MAIDNKEPNLIFPVKANLEIGAPRPLVGEERARALRHRRFVSVAALCATAGVPYRVTGGKPPHVATWRGPDHAYTVNDVQERVLFVGIKGLPRGGPLRALRILEVLAFGHNDYYARETLCHRGYFIA